MKKITILLFSILISFSSYGEWTEVSENVEATSYIDKDTIKQRGGYVYWWDLDDNLKNFFKDGTLSVKAYEQGDCKVNRVKVLSLVFYKQPMGNGKGATFNPRNEEWRYPLPDTIGGHKLNYACNYVK